jgi:hypothetical protein
MSVDNILFAALATLLALLIGIWTLHNHRKAWPASSMDSDHHYGLFVLAPGINPVVECVHQFHYTTINGVIDILSI